MRVRTWAIVLSGAALLAAALAFYHWRTAGEAEVRATTERVATAVGRGDREALASEPLLRNHPETVAMLLRHGPALAAGYRVTVKRNGADGDELLSQDDVSHLGVIETASGTMCLGFWYERETGRLVFVTASYSTFGKWQ